MKKSQMQKWADWRNDAQRGDVALGLAVMNAEMKLQDLEERKHEYKKTAEYMRTADNVIAIKNQIKKIKRDISDIKKMTDDDSMPRRLDNASAKLRQQNAELDRAVEKLESLRDSHPQYIAWRDADAALRRLKRKQRGGKIRDAVFLDNVAIRYLARKFAARTAPITRAYLVYYFAWMSIIGGGAYAAYENLDNVPVRDKAKKAWNWAKDKLAGMFDSNAEMNVNDFKVGPAETYQEFAAQIAPIIPYLATTVVLPEGFRAKPYYATNAEKNKGIATIGFGSTTLSDGTKVTMNTPPITIEEGYREVEAHIMNKEVFMVLYVYICLADKEMNARELVAFGNAVYNSYSALFETSRVTSVGNRFARLRELHKSGRLDREGVRALFEKYPLQMTDDSPYQAWMNGAGDKEVGDKFANYLAGGKGLEQHRWMEACLLTGDLEPSDLLDAPVGYFDQFRRQQGTLVVRKTDREVRTDYADEFNKWKYDKKYNNVRRVKDFLPPDVVQTVGRDIVSAPSLGIVATSERAKESEELELSGNVAAEDSKYENAAKLYRDAIVKNENNLAAYADLSWVLYNLGKYDDGVRTAQEYLRLATPKDKKSWAAVLYNSGLCRQKIAEAAPDKKTAAEQYRLARADFAHAHELLPKIGIYKKKMDDIDKRINELSARADFAGGKDKLNNMPAGGFEYNVFDAAGNTMA